MNNWYFKQTKHLFGLLFFVLLLSPCSLFAQERNYEYSAIEYTMHVNQNTSVDVSEKQTYHFVGEYHQGWRSIPLTKLGAITRISVVDATTMQPLQYSSTQLDKTQPWNWGKYTTFIKNNEQVIEWYFSARDEQKTFLLNYTVEGALGFYRDHDELYWNLLTAYTVPVRQLDANVYLPTTISPSTMQAHVYVDPNTIAYTQSHEAGVYHFSFRDIPPEGKVTIAPGWPKGIVEVSAYWQGFFGRNWGYCGAGLIFFVTLLTLWLRWYVTERYHTGRGAIVPEYAPPQDLRPAVAEVLVTEQLTSKAWTATIVDLSVRGFLEIQEDTLNLLGLVKLSISGVLVLIFFCLPFIFFAQYAVLIACGWAVVLYILWIDRHELSVLIPKDYLLLRKNPAPTEPLESYEAKFLELLFADANIFSTKEMRMKSVSARALGVQLNELRRYILDETVDETKGYAVGFHVWRYVKGGLVLTPFFVFVFALAQHWSQSGIFFITALYGVLAIPLFFRYNPRLNQEGQILREEWLGFKLYLETAEKYRMQNLTPETFEKYLPYAIIFGVEKKWSQAFDGMLTSNPAWYRGPVGGNSAGVASVAGFSASSFSTSFVTSFSSAFSSSSGASGGGGSAGGGGGGGGGGAS